MKFFDKPEILLQETSIIDRFVKYVKIDTTSDENSETCPSTNIQFDLANILVAELKELGLSDALVDENCYVTATLKGTGEKVIGLIAHLDTSSAASGKDVKPIFHKNYDGTPLVLKNDVVIDPATDTYLNRCMGETIITSDGTTLLGADDKSGIAIIMSALEYYKANPDTPHPTIKIGFTPDEEIGRGHAKFPIEKFGADLAFTLDGGFPGELNIETFEAYSAFVTVNGVPTHPGMAKGKLVNALRYMAKFIDKLPAHISPECTEKREGFIHPHELSGNATSCKCHLILRDFDEEKVLSWATQVKSIAAEVEKEDSRLKINVDIQFSYPNMYKFLKDKPQIVEFMKEAISKAGIKPIVDPIRGGTDGSNLSRKGLPTPNIFAGGVNFHGPTEWISTKSIGLGLCTVLNLMALYSK